jgi:hypothetical protein
VERPRCVHCRNPIKEHQSAVGPEEGDRTFHEDCWTAAHPGVAPAGAAPVATPVTDEADETTAVAAGQLVEQRTPECAAPAVPEPSSEQRDYEQRIADGGLAALLSPYVCGLPAQRHGAESIPA